MQIDFHGLLPRPYIYKSQIFKHISLICTRRKHIHPCLMELLQGEGNSFTSFYPPVHRHRAADRTGSYPNPTQPNHRRNRGRQPPQPATAGRSAGTGTQTRQRAPDTQLADGAGHTPAADKNHLHGKQHKRLTRHVQRQQSPVFPFRPRPRLSHPKQGIYRLSSRNLPR